MPTRPLRPCPAPGCPNLVKSGRCPVHERQRQQHADTKTPEARKFYDSPAWRRLRAAHKRKEPLCRTCYANGRVVPMKVVDHIIPREQGGAPLDPANLQSLCASCHDSKRARERHGKADAPTGCDSSGVPHALRGTRGW